MAQKDYYKILGVSENASKDEIKRAYRRLAKKYHPDANPGNKAAEEKFKEISEAHQILSDPEKRKQYDQLKKFGESGFQGYQGFDFENLRKGTGRKTGRKFEFEDLGEFGSFSDIFSSIFDFGERERQSSWEPQKGEDLYSEIEIPFDQAISGGKTVFQVKKEKTCPVCHGTGGEPGSPVKTCPDCGGAGMISFSQGSFAVKRPCPRCYGRGKIIATLCHNCGGSGQIYISEKIAINIPPGINDGAQLRLKGQGKPGISGGPSGDLMVKVNVGEHRFFERKGADIYCQVSINIAQAVLGSKIRVRTINGKVDLKIPPGTQSGTLLRLKGKGVDVNGIKGDQYVKVSVEMPKKVSEKQKKLMEEFAKEGDLKY